MPPVRTLWRDEWIDAPRPHPVAGSTLIEVEATVPLAPLGAAHGREFGSPARKVASFTVTDGPAATLRKARAKRAEDTFTGDYRLTLILGRSGGTRIFALAPRAPRCAEWMLAPEALVRSAPDGEEGVALLRAAGARLRNSSPRLDEHSRQSYLYSGMRPPSALVEALDEATAPLGAGNPGTSEVIRPPGPIASAAVEADETGELLRLPVTGPRRYAPPLVILGAGDYVRIEMAPALKDASLRRGILADREPQIAALAAAQLGFAAASTNAGASIEMLPERGLVLVATTHDSHAPLAAQALDAGHRVICEKPACVTLGDLELLTAAAERNPGELEVGFNRRYNPTVERAREELAAVEGPTTVVATVREVDITPDHWYLWPNQGTRVAGNLCHWIDLALHLIGPGRTVTEISVSPQVSAEPGGIDAERAFTFALDDGSTVVLIPTGRGDSVRGVQERIEVRRGALTLVLDDLWRLTGLRAGRPLRSRTVFRDKGHGRMYERFLARFAAGEPSAYPVEDLVRVGEAQVAATELLRSGRGSATLPELLDLARG